MSNFDFVGERFGQVGAELKEAEKHIFSDIHVYAIKVRLALEEFVGHLIYLYYSEDQTDASERYDTNIERLRKKIEKDILDKIRKIRVTTNPGMHVNKPIKEYDAKLCLKLFYDVLVYAVKIHINRDFVPPPYVEPVKLAAKELPATLDSSILEQYCKNVIDAFNNLSCPFLIFPNVPSIGESEEVGRSVGTLLANPLLVVTGPAGVGKSYLMQALQSLAAAVYLAGPDDMKISKLLKREEERSKTPILQVLEGADKKQWCLVPVILPLREYRQNTPFVQQVIDVIREGVPQATLHDNALQHHHFEQGKCLVVFDGFDELSRHTVGQASGDIKSFISRYPKNRYFITSRSTLPQALTDFLREFHYKSLRIEPLTEKQARSLIRRLDTGKLDSDVEKVLRQAKQMVLTPMNVCTVVACHSKSDNEATLYLNFTKERIQAELKTNRYSEIDSFDGAFSLLCDMAYELQKQKTKSATVWQVDDFLMGKTKNNRTYVDQFQKLIHAAGLLVEETSEKSVFSHSVLHEILVAWKLMIDLRDKKRQVDDPDFCENILQDSDWGYVVAMLLELLQSSEGLKGILYRIIHHLTNIDFTSAIAALDRFQIELPNDICSEVDERTAQIVDSRDWSQLEAAYLWLGEKKFGGLIQDSELPTFWKDVVEFRLSNKMFDEYDPNGDRVLSFVRKFSQKKQSNGPQGHLSGVRYSWDLQRGLTLLDVKEWLESHSPSYDALSEELRKSLQCSGSKRAELFGELQNNFSIETARWLLDVLSKWLESGADDRICSEMIVHLGRIAYANSGSQDLEPIVLNASELITEIIRREGSSKELCEDCYIAWHLLDHFWNARRPYTRTQLGIEPGENAPTVSFPQIDLHCLRQSPAAVLVMDSTMPLCHRGLSEVLDILDVIEEHIETLSSSMNWRGSSLEVQRQLLKNILMFDIDTRWPVFKGLLSYMPLCWMVSLGKTIWQDLAFSAKFDTEEREGFVVKICPRAEAEEGFEEKICPRLESWTKWLRSPCKPLQIMVSDGVRPFGDTNGLYPRIEEMVKDAFCNLREETNDPDILFHIRPLGEYGRDGRGIIEIKI